MEWLSLTQHIAPTAIPSALLIFLIGKFNKLEHDIKDQKIWISENYVSKSSCEFCRNRLEQAKEIKKRGVK